MPLILLGLDHGARIKTKTIISGVTYHGEPSWSQAWGRVPLPAHISFTWNSLRGLYYVDAISMYTGQ
jgi:hypothetical protein